MLKLLSGWALHRRWWEDALEHRVMEVAEMIADNAPLTVAAMKFIFHASNEGRPRKQRFENL